VDQQLPAVDPAAFCRQRPRRTEMTGCGGGVAIAAIGMRRNSRFPSAALSRARAARRGEQTGSSSFGSTRPFFQTDGSTWARTMRPDCRPRALHHNIADTAVAEYAVAIQRLGQILGSSGSRQRFNGHRYRLFSLD
jgi:hypothetical protein